MTLCASHPMPAAVAKEQALIARRIGGSSVDLISDPAVRQCVPVALRSALHVTVSRGRIVPPFTGNGVISIMWVIRGGCIVRDGDKRMSLGPGHVAICLPTDEHQMHAVTDSTEIIGFGIEGPLAGQFLRELNLRAGVYPYGPAPVVQIHGLMDSLEDSSHFGRQRASMLAISAVYDIADVTCARKTPAVIQQAREMIQQEFADPDLSCEALAAKFGRNRAYFSRMFRRYTGATVMDYLTQVRLGQAQSLIRHSDHKVAEIGQMCGFPGPSYFARWMRKHTGYRPGELRRRSKADHLKSI